MKPLKNADGSKLVLYSTILFIIFAWKSLFAQDTAFTYQGFLTDGGAPGNGYYDLSFSLYPTNAYGNQIAATITNTDALVSNGLFYVLLDFGPVFTGTNYWLEIGVRTNGNTGGFSILSPRQAITPIPYSWYALNAGQFWGVLASSNLPSSVVFQNSSPVFTGSVQATGFIGSGNGLTNISNAALVITPLTNNQQTVVNLSSNLNIGGVLTVDSQNISNAFSLSPRNALPNFPVPVLRPVNINTVLAFDLMPNGSPQQFNNDGITWFDVCNADFLNGNGAIGTARVGINTNYVFFGAMDYSGATKLPVEIGRDEIAYLTLDINGNLNGSNNTNAIGYLRESNINAGTNAYAELSTYAYAAQAALRSYSSTYAYDSGSYQNSSSVSGSGTGGLVLLANATGAHVKIVTGNNSIMSNTRLDIDGNGIATFYNNVITSKTNSSGFLISQNTLMTKGLAANVVTETNTYTATANDFLIRCDTTANGFTIKLPAAVSSTGQILNIKKISGDNNTLTIQANGSDTIDGNNIVTTTAQWTNLEIISDGNEWNVLN